MYRIFGITLLLLVFPTIILTASNIALQNVRVSINLKNASVKEVLHEIKKQTSYSFLYNNNELDENSQVTINVKDAALDDVLDLTLKNQNLAYEVENKVIMIYKPRLVKKEISNKEVPQQDKRKITGIIIDGTTNEPLVGVTIAVSGTTIGAISDDLGNFTIDIPENATLNISYIGFIAQSIKIGKETHLRIVLQEDSNLLEDVIVVGYGVQKKVNLTGSISNVKADELTSIPVANLSNTLAGRAPGATIVGTSGLIGATSSIRIRGGFAEPLYVIDGVISTKTSFDALDPSEIDQMSFLKDAATASVYGSNAGNGVVLVKTKEGDRKAGKPQFTYQGSYSFSNPTKKLMTDQFTASDELLYQNRVAEFRGTDLPNGQAEFDYFKDRDYNIMDWIWQTPWNTKHNISVSGGNENIQYYMMGGFMKEEGSFINLKSDKYNIRSNVTAKLSKYIKMNLNISGSMKEGKRFYWPSTSDDDYDVHDLYRSTFNVPRTYPFYVHKDGTPADEITEYPLYPNYGGWTGWNVVDQVIGNRYLKTRDREVNAILSFDVDLSFITKGLSTKILGNYKSTDRKWKRFLTFQKNYGFQMADPTGNRFLPGPINENDVRIYNFNKTDEELYYQTQLLWSEQFNWFLNYNNTFGKHDIAATMVFEQASNGGEFTQTTAKDPLTEYDQWFVFSSDAQKRVANAGEYTGGRLSWIGRLNYTFDSKYIAEFSFRYDGNDNFSKNKRWGFFPSVSAAWRINQESFMEKSQDWLSDFKLRLSYGTTGNPYDVDGYRIASFSYIDKYITGSSYMFGNSLYKGIKQGAIPNPNVTWATSRTYNAGVDFGFLNNRLNGTIDAFYKKESDILGYRTVSLPTTYGQSLAPENYAERSWKGAELTINWADRIANGDIHYSVYANMGYATDQWDKIDQSAAYVTGNLQDLSRIGLSHSRQIGYLAKGIIRTQEELDELLAAGFTQWGRKPYLGAILYEDTRGDGYAPGPDGKVDGNDYYNLLSENTTPRINYGFGGEISYKGFSLSLHFQGVTKYDRFIGGVEGGFAQWGGTLRPYYPIWANGDVWTAENPNAKYPRVVGEAYWMEAGAGSGSASSPYHTSFWKRNGAYLRLKNLNFAYNLPSHITKPIGLTNAQVFMNATNLFYISAVGEFHDPEQKNADSYPLMRTFTFGLNISF